MTPTARLGLTLLSAALWGCQTTPPIIKVCPPIPTVITADCYVEAPTPTINRELAEQWVAYRACAAEQSIKLKAVAALAECRIKVD